MTASILAKNQFGHVSKVALGTDFHAIEIEHQCCTASISLYGGQVLTWQPTDEKPVFWLSKDSHYSEGSAIRGGIPICWPWFGGYKDAGNHGFVRQQKWQLDDVIINDKSVDIILSWQGAGLSAVWPYPARLVQRLSFGRQFTQVMEITNLSGEDVSYTGALHSYFVVSLPENTHIKHLSNESFDCKLTGRTAQKDELENCKGPIDRIYYNNDMANIVDTAWDRVIEVTGYSSNQWVLWNPGADIAKTMTDIHTKGENEYVCLEAANTKEQLIRAGETVSLGQKIRVL